MGKNRIIVVEDDKSICDGIAVNLSCSGYDYTVFDNGQSAADSLILDHSYDVALLDIMLPGMDGFELMTYMGKYKIPVIFLTAKEDAPSEVKGLREGAEDYIIKPFDMLSLLVRIEKVLERSGKLNSVYRIQDITLDIEQHTVLKNGEEIILKPLEFQVFAMLIKYKNRTISRDKLLNQIWGVDYFGDTRTVDVHISNLRKKLGLNDAIKAIPKCGYRLEE